MWFFFRVLGAIAFLFSIIFSIPLAFDVGGRTCGLAFSLALSTFYFFFSTLKIAVPSDTRARNLVHVITGLQWVVLPTLLLWSLNRFSIDAENSGSWVGRTFGGKRAQFDSVNQWIFGSGGLVESSTISVWDSLLRYSTPIFQLSEGFCSLLVIQAIGQVSRYLVNQEGGDAWMIGLMIASASTFSSSTYFLWRIAQFPEIDNVDAILIGAAIACAIILSIWGISSGRGNPAESALLFAYVTLCIYQIFTDYRPAAGSAAASAPPEPNFPPLPPIIMASYSTLLHALSTLPSTIHSAFNFFFAAIMTITPSVLISLTYRIFVMYFAARIVPAIRESGARALSHGPSLEDSEGVGRAVYLLSYYSPSILIAVYSSLLMQHFASNPTTQSSEWWTNQGGNVGSNIWRWINLAGTMGLYALELFISKDQDDMTHWKID